ncbi:putative membrane protein, partial [Cucurbita argyrosperma subsp. argyrosperma]
MANPWKGKLIFIYFLFVFGIPHVSRDFVCCSSSLELNQSETEVPFETRQYDVLKNLEELVRNLSDVVSKLELRLSNIPTAVHRDVKLNTDASRRVVPEVVSLGGGKEDGLNDGGHGVLDTRIQDGGRGRAVSVTKYSPFWSERFHFLSAVKLESDATSINVLPLRDFEGHSKYVAVGDETGRIYVFVRNGDVAVELRTMSGSPITAMLSYMSIYKNETLLVTGHESGAISMHRIWEGSNGEESNSIFMEPVLEFVVTDGREEKSPISILEVHHVGRTRYILSSDVKGKIKVFREDGTVYGSVMPTSRPIAFLKQRLLFLTETGAGSLDLRSMKLRESECEGLNYSLARNYVFDATERSKAYGFTSDGDLIHVMLLGDIMNFKCRVRSKKKFELDEPLFFQAVKGYLLVIGSEKVHVFNVSSQHYVRVGAPRLLFSARLDEIRSSFLNNQNLDLESQGKFIPLISSDREKLVVLGLGGGYIGMYRSNLPIYKGEFNTMLWTSPVLFFILFLFGAWQFFAKKKEALTSWGPDDPFTATSPTTGAPLGTGSTERTSFIDTPSRSTDMRTSFIDTPSRSTDMRTSFIDTPSRSTDMMDLRGGSGLRGPPRRYGSPTGYPGGVTSSFRPATTSEHSSRQAAVDPNYRAASELKFRGSPLEPPGFPKRREPLFANNQVVNQVVDESS